MNDQDWIHDLFERSRREAEPAWTPDTAAIAVGGRRRRRLRAVSVGGGALGALAVTAAVAFGLGGFSRSASVGPGTTPPHSTSVLDYASISIGTAEGAETDQVPDPSMVLKPNPFSEQQLAAVLAGPQFGPTAKAKPVGSGPKQFLKTGDLGTGAAYDPSSSGGSTGDLPMDNGCDYKDINPLAKPGRTAAYTATTPGGKKVTLSELEYPLPSGTGPATMATARSQAKGGCDQQGTLYSKDTATDFPAGTGTGIGDEAFVENGVGTGAVTVWMRFGDTILRIDITQHQTPGQSLPDLSAPADQAWVQSVARAAAGHWTAKD